MDKRPILVLGDVCIDSYNHCACSRLAPDYPIAVLDVIEKTSVKGMAGNLYENLRALGLKTELIGNKNWKKVTKDRYLHKKTSHLFIRVDSKEKIERLTGLDEINFSKYSAVAIGDYQKGALTEDDINFIGRQHSLVTLDTKKILGKWAESTKFIKINRAEYAASKPFLTKKLESKIIETLGEHGCRFGNKVYAVDEVEIKNLNGCGDSFHSAFLGMYLFSEGDMDRSLEFSNFVGTLMVQHRGTPKVDKEDLRLLKEKFGWKYG